VKRIAKEILKFFYFPLPNEEKITLILDKIIDPFVKKTVD
jgi:hypothetical protein